MRQRDADEPELPVSASDVPWERLSPRALAIARRVAAPIVFGYTAGEVAEYLGCSRPLVSAMLKELRQEIVEQIRAARSTPA